MDEPESSPAGPRKAPRLDLALYAIVALIVLALGALLVDLVLQRSWLDVALLLIGGTLVTVCYFLQRWSRPRTG